MVGGGVLVLFIHLGFCFVVRFKSSWRKNWKVPAVVVLCTGTSPCCWGRSWECPFHSHSHISRIFKIILCMLVFPSHTTTVSTTFLYHLLCLRSCWQLYDAGVLQYLHVRLCYSLSCSGEICSETVIVPRGAVTSGLFPWACSPWWFGLKIINHLLTICDYRRMHEHVIQFRGRPIIGLADYRRRY